jgi:hypothetical protein
MSELPNLAHVWLTGIALAKNLDGRLEMATLAEGGEWQQVWRRWERLEGGWTRWQPSGEPGSYWFTPALAMNRDGRLEAAVVGNDEAVWHAWQRHPGRAWTEWQTLGTSTDEIGLHSGRSELARNQDGRLELFVMGRPSSSDEFIGVWHCRQSEAGTVPWSAWYELFHPPKFRVEEITVAQNQDGRLELFASADDGRVSRAWHIWQPTPGASTWSSWDELKVPRELSGGPGTGLSGRPAVARNQDGRLELFMQGSDGNVWHCWQSAPGAGPWSPWHSLGNPPFGQPQVAAEAQADGRLVLFAFATGGDLGLAVLEQTAPNDGWSSWRTDETYLEQPVPLRDVKMALDADQRLELWAVVQRSLDLFFVKQTSPNSREWKGGVYVAAPQPASTGSEQPPYIPTPAGSEETGSGGEP